MQLSFKQVTFSRLLHSAAMLAAGRCPIVGSLARKIFLGRQFTGKNPPLPAAVRAGRIFAGNRAFTRSSKHRAASSMFYGN